MHEQKVAAFVAEFEHSEALTKAGVSITPHTHDIKDAMGNKLASVMYIRFTVPPKGVPSTESPAAQAMA